MVGEGAKERPPREPTTSEDDRSEAEVVAGFEKARAEALACKGGPPGLSIKIQAHIDAEGNVLSAKPITSASLPVAQCVAKAVKTHARFPKSTRVLDTKTFTYTF